MDGEGKVHWPVLLLYDEFDQSDYIQVGPAGRRAAPWARRV